MIHLYNQDCMEAMASMKDNEFDLAIVDPPYGINRDGQKYSKPNKNNSRHGGHKFFPKKNWDSTIPTKEYFEELFRVSNEQIIWGGNYFVQFLKPSMGWIFWDKLQRGFNSDGELAYSSFKKALKVIGIQRGVLAYENTIHPTQKPVALYTWLLDKYAQQGWKILDTHLGSGSSAIAAHDMGYEFHGYELDEEYFEAASKRLKEHQKQLQLF